MKRRGGAETGSAGFLNFVSEIWENITGLIQNFPGYGELNEVFKFDIQQMVNATRYDCLLNRNLFLINKEEYWLYSPHTMQFVLSNAVDLMACRKFSVRDLGRVRKINWQAQRMARIGNWVATWEKEMKKGDFSSGVFAYALDIKGVTPKIFKERGGAEVFHLIRRHGIEKILLEKWEKLYRMIPDKWYDSGEMDTAKLLRGLREILKLQIITKDAR